MAHSGKCVDIYFRSCFTVSLFTENTKYSANIYNKKKALQNYERKKVSKHNYAIIPVLYAKTFGFNVEQDLPCFNPLINITMLLYSTRWNLLQRIQKGIWAEIVCMHLWFVKQVRKCFWIWKKFVKTIIFNLKWLSVLILEILWLINCRVI